MSTLILCQRCAEIVAQEEREDRAFAEIIPPHLHLYDFGDGVTTMPVPDFSSSGSYLTASVCFLEDNAHRVLGVDVRHKKTPAGQKRPSSIIDNTNILEALAKAVLLFESRALEPVDGGLNPKAVKERVMA